MAIGPRLDLRLGQALVMTPQLRQAIQLLQFSNLEVQAWVDGLGAEAAARLLVHDGYLDNPTLDRYIAAMDAIPLLLTNNGPSGIMGKAESAGVPVVTAGSVVRAREARALGAGVACDLEVGAVGRALRTVLDPGYAVTVREADLVPPARYARAMLGLPDRPDPS